MIDLMSIITGICPINDLIQAVGGDMFGEITKQLEELPKQLADINKLLEELDQPDDSEDDIYTSDMSEAAKKKAEETKKKLEEKKEQIKEETKKKLEEAKENIEKQIEDLKKQMEEMVEQLKKKFEDSIAEAQKYADKIVQAGSGIPPAVTGFTTALASLITQATGAVSAAIMNPGSISFTMPSILAATQNVNKTKDDLKAAALDLTASVAQLDKALGLVFSVPVVGAIIQTAVMTPINVIAKLVETAIKIIP